MATYKAEQEAFRCCEAQVAWLDQLTKETIIRAVREYIDTVGREEGVTYIDSVVNPAHRKILEAIEDTTPAD